MPRFAATLLLLYLGLIPLAKIALPVWGVDWPLPELFFGLLLGSVLADAELRRALLCRRPDRLDWAAAGLVLAEAVSWWVNTPRSSLREVLVLAYLAVLFRLTRTIVRRLPDPERFVWRAAAILGAVLVLSGIGSWLAVALFPEVRLWVFEPKHFPGWGTLPRLEGLTMSPNLFANLGQLPLLVLFAAGRTAHRRAPLLAGGALLLLTVVATGSKSLPLLAAGLLLVVVRRAAPPLRYGGWGIGAALVLFFLIAPKVLPIRDGQADRTTITRQSYFAGDTLGRIGPYTLYASTHLRLNRIALDLFRQHPLMGYGPGAFPVYLAELQDRGQYPRRLPRYDPHQLYLGTLAQTGLTGFVALAFFLWQLGRKGKQGRERNAAGWYAGLAVYLLLWALEGWHMDTLHFRQFWWVAGVVAGLSEGRPRGGGTTTLAEEKTQDR
jgi:O-antigen ligase